MPNTTTVAIPQALFCPITHELFKRPVIAEDGYTYEESAISAWVKEHGTSPKTGEKLSDKFIFNRIINDQLDILAAGKSIFSANDLEIPDSFFCRITFGLFTDPVVIEDGYTFERSYIEYWVQEHGKSPITNINISSNYIPNLTFKDLIADFFAATKLCTFEELLTAVKANDYHKVVSSRYPKDYLSQKDKDGATLLHHACISDFENIAAYLLDQGSNPNALDLLNRSPLFYATSSNSLRSIERLYNKGGNLDFQSSDAGLTALQCAVALRCISTTEFLLSKGAKLGVENKNGLTALHFAAAKGFIDIFRLLLKSGAEIECRSKTGFTPLHLATYHNHQDMIELLLDNGVQINTKALDGNTPLHTAVERSTKDVVSLLLENGADYKEANNNGLTALELAKRLGKNEIVQSIKEFKQVKRTQLSALPLQVKALEEKLAEQAKEISELKELLHSVPSLIKEIKQLKDQLNSPVVNNPEIADTSPKPATPYFFRN